MTSFEAIYGRPPPIIPYYQIGHSTVHKVNQSLAVCDALLSQLKQNLHVVRNRMKQATDKKRRDIEFQGDLVFFKLHQCRQQTVGQYILCTWPIRLSSEVAPLLIDSSFQKGLALISFLTSPH